MNQKEWEKHYKTTPIEEEWVVINLKDCGCHQLKQKFGRKKRWIRCKKCDELAEKIAMDRFKVRYNNRKLWG